MKTIIIWEHSRPPEIDQPDWSKLHATLVAYMDAVQSVESGGYVNEDFTHYVFEQAIEALYGKQAWEYINERLA